MGTGALSGAGASRICDGDGHAAAGGVRRRQRLARGGAGQRAAVALGGKRLGEGVQSRRAHAVQSREADADAVVHVDGEVHQLVRHVAQAIDVGGDVVEGDGPGASRLYGRAVGATGNPIGEGRLQATGNGESGAGSAGEILGTKIDRA